MPRKKLNPENNSAQLEPNNDPLPTEAVVEPSKDGSRPGRAKRVESAAPSVIAPEIQEPQNRTRGGRGRKPKSSQTEEVPAPSVVAEASAPQEELEITWRKGKTEERKGIFGRRRNERTTQAQEPVPVAAQDPAPPAVNKRSGRGGRKVAAPPVITDQAPAARSDSSGSEDLPIPSWRPRTTPSRSGKRAPSVEATQTGEPQAQPGQRRSRNRRRTDALQPEVMAEPAAQAPAEPSRRGRAKAEPPAPPKLDHEPLPDKPARAIIPIPNDAPQVVLRDGIPTLVRAGTVYPPIAFFGSSSDEIRAANVIDEMRMAGEAGVHLHSHLVEFEVDPRNVEASVAFAAYMLNKSLQADPEAQVLFRVVFIAPASWQEQYPNARYLTADGALGEPSVCDDDFWDTAKNCLRTFVRSLRMLDTRDHILGVHLERGEWFFGQGWGYDTSLGARNKFRDWARVRYRNDVVALRAAWFDGGVNFNTLTVPEYQGDDKVAEKFVRSSRKERHYVDYHLFLSDATVERIGDLAYTAKESSEGYFLVGASYGYTFEWSHPASGHLSLGKLLRTPEIDFIAGPPSYRSRQPGGVAPFPGPIDSYALNGKLYISEEDFKTAIGQREEPDDFNPIIKTPQALESIHWRGAGSALAHASGVCWMDLWGNGWLKTPGIWDRAKMVRDCLIRRMAAPLQDPEVAVFIDERALAYLVDEKAFALLVQNVRESVLRSGLNAAFYLLSDLQHREKFPESKLYVFLNAWDIRPELRAAIKSRLQRENKVLFWVYAAGLFDSGRESLERAREVTGIALKPQPFHSRAGTTILNRRHALCEAFPERGIVGEAKMEPSYFAIPEEATVLGEYNQTGLPSFVVKEFNYPHEPSLNWKSVFLGEPVVTPALLRALGQMAGAHVWDYQDDVVHVRPPFLTIHCTGTGSRTLALPAKWSAYNLASEQWTDGSSIRFTANDGSTHLFLVGRKEDLDAVLSADPETLLRMDILPPRPDNTIRFDAASFDVPIMKLDEWIEGSDGEEMAEDFLFKPRVIEELEEAPEAPGRRRRRRGRGREGSEETASIRTDGERTTVAATEDLSMNVVFRRRR